MSNRIDIIFPEDSLNEINGALEIVKRKLDLNINLNPNEAKGLSRIDTKRYTFVKVAFELAEAYPYLQSPFIQYDEAKRDFTAFNQLGIIESALLELLAKVSDLKALTGHEAYMYALAVYEQSQIAMKKGVPGAKAAYDQMKPFFEKTRAKKEEKK